LHAVQLGEAGIPVLMGLLPDIDALVLLMMLVDFFAHDATVICLCCGQFQRRRPY
jgi:hypothetical protein